MSKQINLVPENATKEPYNIEKERLYGGSTELTSFYFHQGANVYVFSYIKEGVKRHTFIDAGDSQYRSQMLPLLIENNIDPGNIDRIIITHRHPDHCGLAALLAKESGAKILVHSNFRGFIEGDVKPEEQRWAGNFVPSQLGECDIEYLPQLGIDEVRSIGGIAFPGLVEPIEIGESGQLMILACPESTPTHSPDQIIILYSPDSGGEDLRPTDYVLFSGDLWLMRGPVYHRDDSHAQSMPRKDHREQDSKAKEALKKGFHLIRVKPGHGDEFIGSNIIPNSILADRDLLLALGYPMDANTEILRQKEMAPRIEALTDQAYSNFIREILYWTELGYTPDEISALLVRVYKEQSGGGPLAAVDRKQRRRKLKETLTRLKKDKSKPEELHQLTQSTLSEFKRVS